MKINNQGLSLVELLVVVAILSIVLGAILVTYSSSLRVFTDVKSLSDPIETKTPSIELIARYFDRWGVGVIAKTHRSNCTICPAHPMSMTITSGNPCDEVTFYGNLYGFGFVRDVSSSTAQLISCRLDSSSNQNCYTLWRDNTPINDYASTTNNPIILGLSSLSPSNADCSTGITSSTTSNATMNYDMSPYSGSNFKRVKPADVIHRAAHRIRLYCQGNANDGGRTWLYADLIDFYGACNENETATPIAPVNSFRVDGLPSGCNASAGDCTAVRVTVVFRSQSPDYKGQFKTYEVTRVFGR
ncbi:MAG: prepilin-type N-terminal cleavage/methylation domain-containing protein [Candidatus Micrarchaeia archaeon]